MLQQETIRLVIDSQKHKIRAVQVCHKLTPENSAREINGLNNALDFFKSDNGIILTLNEKDAYTRNGKLMEICPVWEFIKRMSA